MITNFDQLYEHVKGLPSKRVALIGAEDKVQIDAAIHAVTEGLASFTLMGDAEKIRALLPADGPEMEIVHTEDPAGDAVARIHSGEADLLMKGRITTGELLKKVLDREKGLRQGDLLNHIAVVESPQYHKFVFISDGGINLHLDEDVFTQMVRNDIAYLKRLGIHDPKVGMMSIIETVSEKIPETVMAQNVAQRLAGECMIEGPIAPDVALFRRAAGKKGLSSTISGEVDVFIMPNTASANHLVKGLINLGGCKMGGVIVGASVPIILLSRSDDAATKFRSIMLGLL